jgi:hypothetical protein
MRPLLLAVAGLLAAAAPAAAQAAEIHTDRDCYLQTDKTTVSVQATGFPAGLPATVSLDGQPLEGGSTAIGGDGTMTGAFNPPGLARRELQETFTLAVDAAGTTATTRFTVTRFRATFTPSRGDPAKLRVRFAVHGFGLDRPGQMVYVHYVAPGGKLRKTVALGHARGQCGAIPRTAKRRLFPFAHPKHGKWRLQFDTSRRYVKGTAKSSFLFYTVGVRVRAA